MFKNMMKLIYVHTKMAIEFKRTSVKKRRKEEKKKRKRVLFSVLIVKNRKSHLKQSLSLIIVT